MAKRVSLWDQIGSWAFIIGVVIALVLGALAQIGTVVASILVVLGLIVGLLNITAKETTGFLLSGITLVIVSVFGAQMFEKVVTIGPALAGMLNALLMLIIPATIIVALRAVYALAHDR